jgi:hypothetical protein
MTGTEITRRSAIALMPPNEQFEFDWRMGKALAASGMFKDARQAEQAFAKIVVGRELGLSPAQAMTGLHLVEGNVQAHYATLGLFVRSNDYDYKIVEHTNDVCSIDFFDPNGELLGNSSFSIEDAMTAGLTGRGAKMYEKFPRNMLFARAMSNGVKWFCPEVLGGVPVYFEGEIESQRVIDGAPEGSAMEPVEVSLAAVAEDIPEDLRQRFYDAYGEAAHLRPGQVSVAAAGMSVRLQPRERVEEFIAGMEATNEQARIGREDTEPVDAEVVPDDPDIPLEPVAVREDAVESLREQIAVLEARQVEIEENPGDFAETSLELDRIAEDVERLEGLIRAAEDAGQGRLM